MDTAVQSGGPPGLPERDWDRLLTVLREGRAVPVVGPELLCAIEDGKPCQLYDVWGARLARQAGLQLSDNARGTPLLYQATNQLSQSQGGSDLAYDVDEIVRRTPWPVPDSLRQLAEIRDFTLYISTTIDHLLHRAVADARPDARPRPRQILFAPRGDKNRVDLPEDYAAAPVPAVFQLFGATSTGEGTFAKTEDDLIDFSWSLLDRQYEPERLYDFLQDKHVLLLGGNFPDWLGRFFIHALSAGRAQARIKLYYVSERVEPGLQEFLKRKRATCLLPYSPAGFVDELHRRWKAAQPDPAAPAAAPAPTGPAFKRGAVFLSYASEDVEPVRKIRAQLEAAGIDTWMDERGLEPGVEYQRVIHDHIREAAFFLAVISRALDVRQAERPGRFVLKEWRWAEDASLERPRSDRYLQPVVIDDTPRGAPFIDETYRQLQWTGCVDGQLPAELVQFIQQGIRRFRRAGP
jgi:hypothetical protein